MSIEVMSKVWGLAITTTQKLVLLALADHADDTGANAYPSVARLAAKVNLDRRNVQRTLRALEEAGYLTVGRASNPTLHHATSYVVVNPGEAQCHPAAPAPPGGASAAPPAAPVPPPQRRQRRPNHHVTTLNPTHTVNAEPLTERVAAKRKAKATAEEGASPASFAAFWAEWPKRVEKQAASVLWKKIQPDEVSAVMLGLRRWKESGQWDEVRFCPNPDKWLRRRKWEDEIKPAAASGGFVG